MPSLESECANLQLFLKDLILKRYLIYKFTPDLAVDEPNYDILTKVNYGVATTLKEGVLIAPLPSEKTYQVCYQKLPGKHKME